MLFKCNIKQSKVAYGTVALTTSGRTKVTLGFKPKYLACNTPGALMQIYDENYSTTKVRQATSSIYAQDLALGGSTSNRLYSIDDDGFTYNKANASGRVDTYFAIGE